LYIVYADFIFDLLNLINISFAIYCSTKIVLLSRTSVHYCA